MKPVKDNPQGKTRAKYKAGKRVRSRRSRGGGFWIVIAVVVAIGVAAVAAMASGSKSTPSAQPASAAVLKMVSSVPTSVFDQVGVGTAASSPKAISAPALTVNGKPHIVYIGAEYCPYCAAERWPMVVALSRFGTFTGLKTTHSSSTDVFPNTQTFSFHGARYASKWISFSGTEMQSNVRQGDGYAPLDRLSAQDQQLLDTYDRAPYTDSGSNGAIPFVDFGGKFVVSGASYDAGLLQGKSTADIARALADPTTAISQGAIGTANTFTAAICSMTGDQPSNVCSSPAIQRIESSL